ncbi:MAG: CDP-diacylglycerol--glycerol-3-phosphate 3-phosphatidyltransferase [Alphaproteobacteria bacterium]|nr:MAG: CDP-diacylglycerol--glycerol-3-phosphate 3-phosphatidyltransferase [Alphaproteobacteria bacterium]
MKLNFPNLLTLLRIAVIPLVLGLLWLNTPSMNFGAMVFFAIACITDFFDGYFARRWDQVSAFGRTLDPIADKLLVSLCLFVLVSMDRIEGVHVLPALIILCREILVSGLREYLASVQILLPVSRGAKWKTALQMVAVGALVLGSGGGDVFPTHAVGVFLLWLSAGLTIITAYAYMKVGFKHMDV